MQDDALDRALAQFARTGDPTAMARAYDASAAELLALATRLVGDPVEAEDLVQATFVAAIESIARFDAGRRAMPWLVGILTNRVRRSRRARRSRTGSIEPAATDEPAARSPAPEAAAQHAELDQALTRALDGLSPALHPVVVLHLRHGMPPAEIAFALGRPPATVRSQLARGLQRVRERLPRGAVLPAVLATPLLRGLDAVRTTVLQHAATHAASLAATTGSITIGGLLVMAKQTKVALSAILLATLGAGALWWQAAAAPAVSSPPGDVADAGHLAAAAADAAADPAGRAASTTVDETAPPPRDDVSVRRAAADVRGALRVIVRLGERPLPGAVVELFERGDTGSRRNRAATGADGAIVLPAPAADGYALVVGSREMEAWHAVPGETVDVVLEAPPPCWVRGVVVAEPGVDLAAARVFVGDGLDASLGVVDALTPRADGSFELPVWNWSLIGARAPGALPVHRALQFEPGETVDIRLLLRPGAAALRGRVVDPRGAPIAGAEVEVGDRLGEYTGRLRPDGSRESVVPQAAVSDADGVFTVEGLTPGPVTVHAIAPGCAPGSSRVELRAGAEAQVTVALAAGGRVFGQVRRAGGHPAARARVRSGADAAFGALLAICDAEGRYELTNVPAGRVRLFAEEAGWGDAEAFVELEAGGAVEWSPAIDQPTIDGTLVDAQGRPLVGWYAMLHAEPSTYDLGAPQRVGADGAFSFRHLRRDASMHELRVHPPCEPVHGRPTSQAALRQRVRVGARGLHVVVPDAAMPTAGVRGRVAAGVPARTVVHLRGEAGALSLLERGDDGAFAFDGLTPGPWQLVQLTMPSETVLREFTLSAGEVKDLGVLDVAESRHVPVAVELGVVPPRPDFMTEFEGVAALQVLTADHEFLHWATLKEARTTLSLLPGRYVLRLCGAPLWAEEQLVEVAAGDAPAVRFEPRPAALRKVAFRHPHSDHPFEPLALEVRTAAGALLWNTEVPARRGWWHAELNLPPGDYRLQARTASGLRCEAPLRIEDTAPLARPLLFELRP